MSKSVNDGLSSLFSPKNIAVIGASATPGKIGFNILNNIIQNKFEGEIYPINPKSDEILGFKAYKSITEVPRQVDSAVLVVPARFVPDIIVQCGEKNVRSLIVITSGFGEVGELKIERLLVERAHEFGMRMLGPNIFGMCYTPSKLNATFGPIYVPPGPIALITQSGALGIALMGKAVQEKIGLSAVVSVGNKADITDVDLLDYLSEDPNTKAIMIYMEGTKDGRALVDIAKKASLKKPIVMIKSGRSERGARAAASHTGSLAGFDRIFDMAFRTSGILRALEARDAFNWLRALATQPQPDGEGIVIITNGGGVGVMATDACEELGLKLIDDYALLEKTLNEFVPSFGSMKNPIDITGQGGVHNFVGALSAALAEDKIHAIIGLYCETAGTIPHELAQGTIDAFRNAGKSKPMVISFIGGENMDVALAELKTNDIPAYSQPEDAVSSLNSIYRWWRHCEQVREPLGAFEIDSDRIQGIIKTARDTGRTQLMEHEAREILRVIGLELPQAQFVSNLEECLMAADAIGYPVVMKVVSEDIVHKTDAGGVKLDLKSGAEVEVAYKSMMASCRQRYPHANIRGVLVCEMIPKSIDTIVGSVTDPAFGPVVMFGLGGIYVEVLKDVVFRLTPLTRSEAKQMIHEIKSFPLLYGTRGETRKDIDGIADVIYKIGGLVSAIDEIAELDVNPLRVFDVGKGCKALDARITLKEKR